MAKNNKVNNPQEKLNAAKRIADRARNNTFFDNFEGFIVRSFRWISSFIDKIFFTKSYAVVFALLLAGLLYFVVNFNDNSSSMLSSSKTLTNVNVTARYNSESFEASGIPSSCEITFTGDAANVNNAASKSGYCLIDLDGYTEGSHTVNLVATGYGDNVNIITSPSQVQVTLKRKTTAQFDLSYDFINQNSLDPKFILGTPEFSTGSSKVNIRASQDTLNSIALVKALIDVSNQSSDFEVEAPLVAYNSLGQMVDAEIVPSSVNVKVSITSPHKTVPIKLNISGEAPVGLALDMVSMDHQTTEIYAAEDVLAEVNEVYVNLDLSTVSSDTEIIQAVVLPSGVSASEITMVNLKVSLASASTRTIDNVEINAINNINSYGISYADTLRVSLVITGSQNNIYSLNANDFYAYIDFAGLELGTYDLPVKVENRSDAYVVIEVEPKSLNITLVSGD